MESVQVDVEVRVLGPGDEWIVKQSLTQWGQRVVPAIIEAFLSAPDAIAVAALHDDHLVGFAHGYRMLRPDGLPMSTLYSLDVLPAYRRRGVATRLMRTFRDACGPVSRFWIVADSSNEDARALYLHLGGIPQQELGTVYVWE